ncbi:unnamed protein product [Lota lota]
MQKPIMNNDNGTAPTTTRITDKGMTQQQDTNNDKGMATTTSRIAENVRNAVENRETKYEITMANEEGKEKLLDGLKVKDCSVYVKEMSNELVTVHMALNKETADDMAQNMDNGKLSKGERLEKDGGERGDS